MPRTVMCNYPDHLMDYFDFYILLCVKQKTGRFAYTAEDIHLVSDN
jgi:hypothetical protein